MSPALLVIVILVIALVVFALVATRGKGTSMERLHVERRHDWEKQISEADEEALLAGVEKWRNAGHDLVLYHEGAKVDVYEPPMVLSLYALADAFRKERDVTKLLDDWASREVKGASMHLARDWQAHVADPAGFARLASDVLSEPGIPGVERSGTDDIRGVIDLGIVALGGQRGPMNTLCIDLMRLASAVAKLREQDDKASQRELVRRALTAAVERDDAGTLWTRPPTDEERSVARRGIGRT